jgi:hypothetical protein
MAKFRARYLLALAAVGLVSGCYASTKAVYPWEFAPAVWSNDGCAPVPGTYANRGEADLAEKLPNTAPELARYLLADSQRLSAVDRMQVILDTDRTLIVQAYVGTEMIGASGFTESPSGLDCQPGRALIQPLAVELYKAENGDLILHVTERAWPEFLLPRQFADANWARFPPVR